MDGFALSLLIFVCMLFFSGVSLALYLARRFDSRRALRDARQQAIRSITAAEREAIRVGYGAWVAADAPVYRLQGSARRHGITANGQQFWHYLIGEVEVKPFPGWESHIASDNLCEVVVPRHGPTLPLMLNGATLMDAVADRLRQSRMEERVRSGHIGAPLEAPSQGDAQATVTLGMLRKETQDEAELRLDSAGAGAGWATLLGLACVVLALATDLSRDTRFALNATALACIAWSGFSLWRRLCRPTRRPSDIRTLSGPLILPSLAHSGGHSSIRARLGALEVRYPAHWRPYHAGLAEPTADIDIDDAHRVVRHGRLSLYEERRRFPVARWGWHLAILAGAATTLNCVVSAQWPLDVPVQRALSVLHGARQLEAGTPDALLAQKPRRWDQLSLRGTLSCLPDDDRATGTAMPSTNLDDPAPRCTRLGWYAQPIDLHAFELPAHLTALVPFAAGIRPLPGADLPPPPIDSNDPHQVAMAALLQPSTMPVSITGLNDAIRNIDAMCGQRNDDDCAQLRQAFAALDGRDWPALLADARADQLTTPLRIAPGDAHVLSKLLDVVLLPAIRKAELELWQRALASARPGLILRPDGSDGLSMSTDPYAGRNDALAGWMNRTFQLDGAVLRLEDNGRDPPELFVHAEALPPTPQALFTPLLLGLLAMASLLVNGFALWRALRRRKRRQAAVAAEVNQQLQAAIASRHARLTGHAPALAPTTPAR